ncbi:helix-turn-helix domain-containing protein [Terrabacter terrigena]|uniref:Helix-turn-helix domain-containing protein n=1 Tax=Terrabacter terrigena TaxID=574718 RepID=A0ABW3N247_9MICO
MSAGTNGGYGRGRPRFTDEQRRDILARHDRGESAAAIARHYGCVPAAVYYHLKTTLRHVPIKDRYSVAATTAAGGTCVRCGIDMGRPGMCIDCLEVEGVLS